MLLRRICRFLAFALVVFSVTSAAWAQATYTWNQTGTASWATATNWTPSRSAAATTDILVFNNGATTTVTGVPTQTVAQLSVTGNTAVTLQAAAAGTLTINGGANALSVDSGSQLNVSSNNALTINLAAGSTGTISGAMTFTGTSAATAHKLTAASANAVTFQSGAVFTQGTFASGNAFGATALNSIIFASGSKYQVTSGNASNPFGASAPNSVVTFQTGSLFSQQSTAGASFSGRTYANYELKVPTASSVSVTGGSVVSIDDLTITQGTLNFNMTGALGHVIKGNVFVAPGATLNFNPAGTTATAVSIKGNVSIASTATMAFTPAPAATLNLNGTSAQTITNAGTFNVTNGNQTINVANTSGIALGSDLTIANGALTLTDGSVSTGANTLALGSNVTVARINGYVIGNLKKTFAGAASKDFEVGTANGYSPVTANVTSGTFPADFTASATQSAHPNVNGPTSLQRYWTLSAAGITADLTFQYLGSDVQGNESAYDLIRVSGGIPAFIAPSTLDTVLHKATLTGVTTFSDWTLGEPPDTTPPVVSSIVRVGTTPTKATSVDFTVSFSEGVSGVDTSDFALTTSGAAGTIASVTPVNASTYTVTVNAVSGDGTLRLDFADNDSVVDGVGNPAGGSGAGNGNFTGGQSYTIDNTPPAVSSITRAATDPTGAASVDFTVTFSESVTGVDAADFGLTTTGLTGTSVTGVSGSGTTYTVTADTGSGATGTLRLDLSSSASLADSASNAYAAGAFTGGQSYTIDRNAPSVSSVVRASGDPTNAPSVDFTVTFSQSVIGVGISNFTAMPTGSIAGASATSVTPVSGTVYTVSVGTGTGEGTLGLQVSNTSGSITSTTGTPMSGTFTGGEVYTIDRTAPTVVSVVPSGATPTNASSVNFTVTFSESVTAVDSTDFVVSTGGSIAGASVSGIAGSGDTRTVSVNTGTGDGTIRLDVVTANSVLDVAGNAMTAAFSSGTTYTIDKTAPTVTITRAAASPSSAATVDFTVAFSESVSGVVSGVFGVNASGVTGASVAGVTGSGAAYTVTVNSGTGNGTLGLDLTNGTAVTDAASNPTATSIGQSYTMEGTPSAPTGLTATAGDAHVALTWNASTYATSYAVMRGTTSGGPYTTIVPSVGSASHDDTTATNGTTYYYVVAATGPRGTSGNSNQASGTPTGASPAGGVVISQVYGGGGGSTGTYLYDYIELFNAGTGPVTLTGWSVQYGSAANNFSGVFAFPSGTTIAAGKYLLIKSGSVGSAGIAFPVTEDFTAAINLSGTSGKVALANVATTLTCGATATPCTVGDPKIVDLVAYGAASSAEGGASVNNGSALTSTQGAVRKLSGCQDTNNNNADFDVVTAPVPRNSVTAAHLCSGGPPTNAPPAITAPANPIATVVQDAAPFNVSLSGTDDGNVFNWSATPGTGVTTVNVSGQTTATPTFNVTLVAGFTGTATFTASLTDGVNPAVTQVVNISVAPGTHPDVVISQVYGGGGGGSGTYLYDYIELFNRGTASATLSGYSLQYASGNGGATPDFATANVYAMPTTTIPAGGYVLIQTGDPGTAGVALPVSADQVAALRLGAGSGKVALVSVTSALNCGSSATPCALPDIRILDLVSWGDSTNAEGGATVNNGVALTATQGGVRKYGGCQDTNNNNADFDVVTAPVPRNSASAVNLCSVSNTQPVITAPANPIITLAQDAAPFSVSLTGSDDHGVYTWSATPGFGVASVSVTGGQSTSSVTYTVTLQPGFYGTASFTATLSDTITPAVTQVVSIDVTPAAGTNNPPIITPPPSPAVVVTQGAAPFTLNVSGIDDNSVYSWSAAPGAGIASVTVLSGQGTATVTYTITLNPAYSGTAAFTASLSDGVNPAASRTVTISVTQSGPHLVISQVYGGGGNGTSPTYHNDFVELFNPTSYSIDTAGWTVQYAPATGDFTQFQPLGGVIAPGQYYLIALGAGTGGGATLPAANVSGSINMSGTNGKVALVSNGDLATGCTDADVVDLVGYGSANCYEGSAAAPAFANSAQSLFRANGGNTDTNQNSADFSLGTPNPRQTTPITELGPAVVSTDPSATDTLAPRDANITVNFSEPVDAMTGWFNIACASGLHNSATVASAFGGKTWVIVPNVNFTPGETCTVTVYKDFIHDTDLDDSAPNTDTLPANVVWSFVVSTGAAPPYPFSVHLTMGNPSGAVADINTPNNYLMEKPEYALSYNRDRGAPNWVSWHLTDEWYGGLTRNDTFRADSAVPPQWYRVLGTDFASSGFDRGHMTPNADRDSQTPIVQATFLMSNMVAQAPDNNQGPWANFENYLRTLTVGGVNELYIVSGPAGVGGTGSSGFASTIANGHVTVPASTWKVVMVLPKAAGDDVSRVTPTTRTIAINIPNIQGIRTSDPNDWMTYLTTVDSVETLTGYDFFSNVPSATQNAIEAGTNGSNPPGAANLAVTATEDTAKPVTLNGVSSGGTLTYTIVATPAHGTLTGSGAAQTYTPAPDYFGADSFTYKVNDGTRDSTPATVTIVVSEVNDPPVAVDDALSANINTPTSFAVSLLTANDNAGPNESGQLLTVTGVASTATTHGTVSLSGTTIMYSPDAGYSGPATFTYQVCDNGTTAGVTDSKCAMGTVNLTVAPCPAPPTTPAAVTVAPAVCASSSGNVASIASGFATYTWQITNGTITAGQGTSSITFTAGAGGMVTFNVATTTSSGCPGQAAAGSSQIQAPPTATLPNVIHACAGVSTRIPVTLTGTAPFTVTWSDGLVQANIFTNLTSRQYQATAAATLRIVSVTDAGCSSGAGAATSIVIDAAPQFSPAAQEVTVRLGERATLSVNVSPAASLTWFEGLPHDDSHPVGSGSTFITPELRKTTTYWVRAAGHCDTTDSGAITVTVVPPRRRAVGHH